MTNEQIITNVAYSIWGEDTVNDMISKNIEIPLHTISGWNSRIHGTGRYIVKKGQHGVQTKLWKQRKKKTFEEDQKETFYLAKSYLFRADQLIKIEE